jgi:hypothetical protein
MNHLGDVDYDDMYNEGAYEQQGQHIVTPSRGMNGALRKPSNVFQPNARVRSGSVSSVTRHAYQEAMKAYSWAQRNIGSVASRRISMDNSSVGDRSAKRSISSPTSVTSPPSPPPTTQSSTAASLAPVTMTHDEQASVGGHHSGAGAIRRVSVGHASTTGSSPNLAALACGQNSEGHGQQQPRRRSITGHRNSSWPNLMNQQHMLSRNALSAVDMASIAVAKLQQQQLLRHRQNQIRLARRNAVALRQHHHQQLLALEMEANRILCTTINNRMTRSISVITKTMDQHHSMMIILILLICNILQRTILSPKSNNKTPLFFLPMTTRRIITILSTMMGLITNMVFSKNERKTRDNDQGDFYLNEVM